MRAVGCNAQNCWCRSANLNNANNAMLVNSSGNVNNNNAVNANRCAPSDFILIHADGPHIVRVLCTVDMNRAECPC